MVSLDQHSIDRNVKKRCAPTIKFLSSSRVSYPQLSQVNINNENQVSLDDHSIDEERGKGLESFSIPARIVRFFAQKATSLGMMMRKRKSFLLSTLSDMGVIEDVKRFRLTVVVLSLRDIALKEGHNYYLRYSTYLIFSIIFLVVIVFIMAHGYHITLHTSLSDHVLAFF